MHECECERQRKCVLTRSCHHHPGRFGAKIGFGLVRKLVVVKGFGGFCPHGWRKTWVL